MKNLKLKSKLSEIIKEFSGAAHISFQIEMEDKEGKTKKIKKEFIPDEAETAEEIIQIAALRLLLKAINGDVSALAEVEDYLKLAQRN